MLEPGTKGVEPSLHTPFNWRPLRGSKAWWVEPGSSSLHLSEPQHLCPSNGHTAGTYLSRLYLIMHIKHQARHLPRGEVREMVAIVVIITILSYLLWRFC